MSLDRLKLIRKAIMISLIQHFEADFLWKVSLKILNSGIILKTFTHAILHLSSSQAKNSYIMGLIIISAQMKYLPCHRFSIKSAHRLSADLEFTHLFNSFVMGLPIVNTNQGNSSLCSPKHTQHLS